MIMDCISFGYKKTQQMLKWEACPKYLSVMENVKCFRVFKVKMTVFHTWLSNGQLMVINKLTKG